MNRRKEISKKFIPKFILQQEKQEMYKKGNPCIIYPNRRLYRHASHTVEAKNYSYGYLFCFDKIAMSFPESKKDRIRYLKNKMHHCNELYDTKQAEDSLNEREGDNKVLTMQGKMSKIRQRHELLAREQTNSTHFVLSKFDLIRMDRKRKGIPQTRPVDTCETPA